MCTNIDLRSIGLSYLELPSSLHIAAFNRRTLAGKSYMLLYLRWNLKLCIQCKVFFYFTFQKRICEILNFCSCLLIQPLHMLESFYVFLPDKGCMLVFWIYSWRFFFIFFSAKTPEEQCDCWCKKWATGWDIYFYFLGDVHSCIPAIGH